MHISQFRTYAIVAWAAVMLLGLVIGLIFFARPATSVVEKRDLTPFPAFTVDSFLDGTFFTNLSLWYADTYPLRETLVSTNQAIKATYGFQPEVKFIGGNVAADTIGASSSSSSSSQATSSAAPSANNWAEVDAPEQKPMQEDMQDQLMAGLYIKDGAAYNLYYYYEPVVTKYIKAVNTLADAVPDTTNVYSILVPNGSSVLLSEEERNGLGGTDQEEAIAYFYGQFNNKVHPVDAMAELKKHSSDYIYFRTDHHWTQLGANCAYLAFCNASNKQPQDITTWETMVFDNFLGTFYSETNDPTLIADTVTAYVPPQTNDIEFTDSSGVANSAHVINDVSDWGQGTGYYCYGIGDYQLTHVANPEKTDGSAALLLKDSYGNSLAPQLIGHYQDLWVIDYRYSSTDIVQFIRDHNISDVIIENNVAIATADQVASALLDQVSRTTSNTASQSQNNQESSEADSAPDNS